MVEILLAIAPIFLLIVLGHALRRGGILSIEFWNLNDKLVYLGSISFSPVLQDGNDGVVRRPAGRFRHSDLPRAASAVLFALAVGRLFHLERPLWTSVLQGCARHNTFIALAIAERVFGPEGLALAALVTALLIPVTNVSVVTLMVVLLRGTDRRGVVSAVARDLSRNPLLIAVTIGIAVNLLGIEHIPVVYDMAKILGGAALPIVLLCVGANIRVRAMIGATVPTLLSVTGKMVVFPVVIGLAAIASGLTPLAALIAMVFGAVPSAPGAYTLARQMGGDAPAMATIVTIQAAISFVTLPLTLMLAERLLAL